MQKRTKYLASFSVNDAAVKELLGSLTGMELTEKKMRRVLAQCAGQLLRQRFTDEEMQAGSWLVEELQMCRRQAEEQQPEEQQGACDERNLTTLTDGNMSAGTSDKILCLNFKYDPDEDLLGFLYLSLRELRERKRSGSYYTPQNIAKRLVASENGTYSGTILDPACGTGSILLELPDSCALDQIYGYDIDPLAITLLRINMALKYRVLDRELLTTHFRVCDFLAQDQEGKWDLILGNPPWGSTFTEEERKELQNKYRTGEEKHPESSDLFVEQSLKCLNPGGRICFVIPEALLHVKVHRTLRALILEHSEIRRVEYLGEVFEQVQCPSVILTLQTKAADHKQAIEVITEKRKFLLSPVACRNTQGDVPMSAEGEAEEVRLTADRFLLDVTDEEFRLLQKIKNTTGCVTLQGNAAFALGIVTGNNKAHLKERQEEGCEGILRGADIDRFRVGTPSSYIRFAPEQYQQVAPTALYRAPQKLLYRFVGERPVFAYDDRQTLTLNSCNVLIPKVDGLDMKYIMAVLNSRVIEFWHRRRNHSMKMLRAHIEGFPIPLACRERQQEIIALVEQLIDTGVSGEKQSEAQKDAELYETLDETIADLFRLSRDEYEQVKHACE